MSAQFVSQTVRTATGHWPVILPALGIALQPNGKPQPCPTCGGKDRFRFDNQDGRGTWFCNQCGAGDGLNLVEKALSLSAKAAAEQVAAVMGENTNALPPAAETGHSTKDKAESQCKAARQAQALVAAAQRQTGNAYLSAKGWPEAETLTLQSQPLRVGGITFHPGDLLLPLHNAGGEVVNVQLINAHGDKRMLAGGQMKAACHTLSGPDNAVIWLTEGYATGFTVHCLTGETVCVALSANNLAAVAEQLRSHYPDARLLLAADNDRSGTGQTRAAEAATLTGAIPALPPTEGDWNDVYCQQGAEATRAQLQAFSQPPQPSPFDTLSDADLKAMSASEKAELLAEHYGNTLAVPPVGKNSAAIRAAPGRCCHTGN